MSEKSQEIQDGEAGGRNDGQNAAKGLRVSLYFLLLASAACTFLFDTPLREAAADAKVWNWLPWVAPVLFTIFLAVFAVDRVLLLRRGRYPLGRAMFQLASGIVFLTFLWSTQLGDLRLMRRRAKLSSIEELLRHKNPDFRVIGCEVAAYRRLKPMAEKISDIAKNDSELAVREGCARALKSL